MKKGIGTPQAALCQAAHATAGNMATQNCYPGVLRSTHGLVLGVYVEYMGVS